jgi:hypothetical protein
VAERVTRQRAVLALEIILAATILVIGAVAVWRVSSWSPACTAPVAPAAGWSVVFASGAFFVLGRLASFWRAEPPHPYNELHHQRSGFFIHVLLAVVFLALTFILAYETVGVWNPWGLEPITHYVRCATTIHMAGGLPAGAMVAGVFAAAVSFVAASWLWYPDREPRSLEAQRLQSTPREPAPALRGRWLAGTVALVLLALLLAAKLVLDFSSGPHDPGHVWRVGIAAVVFVLTAGLVGIVGLDLYFASQGWHPVGSRVQHWSRRYPLLSSGLLAIVGALLAHFFVNT